MTRTIDPHLWRALTFAVLSYADTVTGIALPYYSQQRRTVAEALGFDPEETRNSMPNDVCLLSSPWSLEVGDEFYSNEQMDEIILTAPPQILATLSELRAVENLSFTSIGEDDLDGVARIMTQNLLRVCTTRVLNAVLAWIEQGKE